MYWGWIDGHLEMAQAQGIQPSHLCSGLLAALRIGWQTSSTGPPMVIALPLKCSFLLSLIDLMFFMFICYLPEICWLCCMLCFALNYVSAFADVCWQCSSEKVGFAEPWAHISGFLGVLSLSLHLLVEGPQAKDCTRADRSISEKAEKSARGGPAIPGIDCLDMLGDDWTLCFALPSAPVFSKSCNYSNLWELLWVIQPTLGTVPMSLLWF